MNYLHVNEDKKLAQKMKAAPADRRDGFQVFVLRIKGVFFTSVGFFKSKH